MKKFRLLTLLALLMTVATGAWAQLRTSKGDVISKGKAAKALRAPSHKAPSQNDGWYYYDDGTYNSSIGTGNATQYLYWGIMLPAATVVDGNVLTKIAVYEDNGCNQNPITIFVYSGGDTPNEGTLLYQETVETEAADHFHEITLTTPVVIDPAENLWIILGEEGEYPASECEDTGDPNGRWVSFDNSDWYDVAEDIGLNYTWMIRAYFTSFTVDLKANTPDASNWTGKAGSATKFSALPLENVAPGDAVTLKYSGDRRVKTVTATLLQMQSLTVAKGSTELSGDKVLYYMPGDTYRQALARTENQSEGGLGWGYWEDSSLTTIYFKEVSTKAWDVAIDGDSNFGSGKGSCTITLDTEINPTGHTFQFVGSK